MRSRVLGLEPLPSIREAFAYVQNEESRRSAMLPLPSPNRSALASSSQRGGKGSVVNFHKENPSDSTKARDKWCDHCNKPRHVRATCWKLHGRPPLTRGRGGGQIGRRGGGPQAHLSTGSFKGVTFSIILFFIYGWRY